MRKLNTIILLILQFIAVNTAFSQSSGIYITEIMASNDFTLEDVNLKSNDWIEIYNNTNVSVDLANYYMSDDKLLPTKFRFSSVTGQNIIPAFSYKIIWASGRTESGIDHANFTLSTAGEHLTLVAPNGISIMDSLTFPAQYADVSYGRLVSNFSVFRYFSPSSPGSVNNDTFAFIDKLKTPTFNISNGYYDINPLVTISNPNVGSSLKYSRDKSDIIGASSFTFNYQNFYPQNTGDPISPLQSRTLNNFLYSSPIQLTEPSLNTVVTSNYNFTNYVYPFIPSGTFPKANILRARAFKPNYIPSDIATNTYL